MAFPYNQCFAYETLKSQIGQQCSTYGRLHKNSDLGSLPGMYIKSEGRVIPSDDVSSFLRGGIIGTMASFEAYVVDLLNEAYDTILFEREKCEGTCKDCEQLNYDHVIRKSLERNQHLLTNIQNSDFQAQIDLENVRTLYYIQRDHGLDGENINRLVKAKAPKKFKKNSPSLFHKWSSKYQTLLGCNFVRRIFEDGNIVYYYPVDDYNISEVNIDNSVFICAMLKLCYGIRCIMGHGSADLTLKYGELNNFPQCQKCDPQQQVPLKQKTKKTLEDIYELSEFLNTCIKTIGPKNVLKKSRHFPKLETFECLPRVQYYRARQLIDDCSLNCHRINKKNDWKLPLIHDNYAYFHMFRIFHWLKENERKMYVTYRLLVRINQFILVLAYRMKIAVAKILMRNYHVRIQIWNVPKDPDRLKEKIEKFEKKHKKKVQDLNWFKA